MIFWINSIQYLGLSFHDHSHPTMCNLIPKKTEWKSEGFSVQVWDFRCEARPLDIDNAVQQETRDTKSFTEAPGIARPLGVVFDS